MVDVDDEVALEPGHPGPRQVTTLHHDDRLRVGRRLWRDLDAVDAREREVVLWRGIGVDEPDLLAERIERVRHRELRSDRIAVRSGVGGEEEPLPPQNLVADAGDDGRGIVERGAV